MYIATFYTHLGALRFHKKLQAMGDGTAVMMPVPRSLSASCGTCVGFSAPFSPELSSEDLECVYKRHGDDFIKLYENDI